MLLPALLSLLAPHDCLGCGAEGRLLCRRCLAQLPAAIERCYSCHMPTFDSQTCLNCTNRTSVSAVYAVSRYEGLAKDILWRLKFGRARSAATEIGRQIAYRLGRKNLGHVVVTYVPTAPAHIRQRGYDQAQLIAWTAAGALGLPCYPTLVRRHNRQQVGATRQTRMTQLEGAFDPTGLRHVQGKTVLLIDDVVTTGATLEAAAATLRAAGAKRVIAAVFAQA